MLTAYARSVPGDRRHHRRPVEDHQDRRLRAHEDPRGIRLERRGGEGGLGSLEVGRDPLERHDHVFLRQARPQRVQEPVGITRRQRREAPLDDPEVRDADLPRLATDRGVALEDHRAENGTRSPHPTERHRHACPEELVLLPALDLGLVEEDQRAVPAHQLLGPLLVLLDRLPPEHGRGRAAAAPGEQEQQDEGAGCMHPDRSTHGVPSQPACDRALRKPIRTGGSPRRRDGPTRAGRGRARA